MVRPSMPITRKRLWNFLAAFLAMLAFLVCLVGPLCLYMVAHDLSFNDKAPEEGIWLVLLGGAIGTGVSVLVFSFVSACLGGNSKAEVDSQ